MRGFEFDGDHIHFWDGERLAFTDEGRFAGLAQAVDVTGVEVTFPSPVMDWAYAYRHYQDYQFGLDSSDNYYKLSQGQVVFTALPESTKVTQVVQAVPAGADTFFGRVRLTRTKAPSHAWNGDPLTVLPQPGEWISWSGSALLEAALGFARALDIYITGGNLVIRRQQSVSVPAGGYGSWGPGIGNPMLADRLAGETLYNVAPGVPALTITSSPYRKASATTQTTSGVPSFYAPHRLGGSDPCSTVDPSDFSSVYSIDLNGYVGRSSPA